MTNFKEAHGLLKSNILGVVKIVLISFCFSLCFALINGLVSSINSILGSILSIVLGSFVLLFQINIFYRLIINKEKVSFMSLLEEGVASFKENGIKTVLSLLLCSFLIVLVCLVGLVPFFGIILYSIKSGNLNVETFLFGNLIYFVLFMLIVIFGSSYLSSRMYYKVASRVFNADEKYQISKNNKDMLIMAVIVPLIFLISVLLQLVLLFFGIYVFFFRIGIYIIALLVIVYVEMAFFVKIILDVNSINCTNQVEFEEIDDDSSKIGELDLESFE